MTLQVQVLCGPIGSGKSTYAANAARAGCLIVNDDSLVTAVHGGDYSLYDKSLKPIYKSVGQTILTHAAALGRSVVVDTGSRTRLTRARWVSLAKALDLPVIALVFKWEAPQVHAKRRVAADARGYDEAKWLEVAQRHQSEYQTVDMTEGFDATFYADWSEIKEGRHIVYAKQSNSLATWDWVGNN